MNLRPSPTTPVIVAGLCSHGLAVCRALARHRIPVLALESDDSLPGYRTKVAQVTRIPEVNGEQLIESLRDIGKSRPAGEKPVLFLTNDNMVRMVGENWADLEDHYQLSWAASRQRITHLLDKSNCENFLRERKYPLPDTWLCQPTQPDFKIIDSLPFPVIVKPSQPLGEFKAIRIDSSQELRALIDRHQHSSLIIQEWIPGGDENIYFCATVAKQGKPLCFFDGVKFLSHPPARGQTVVAGPSNGHELRDLLERFLHDGMLDGPASIEAKQDANGGYRIIEPTVGRTDFWADLAIANGVDLPYVEYMSVVDPTWTNEPAATPVTRIWFDTEKDPASFVRLIPRITSVIRKMWLPTFTYFDLRDINPFLSALAALLPRTAKFLRKRLSMLTRTDPKQSP